MSAVAETVALDRHVVMTAVLLEAPRKLVVADHTYAAARVRMTRYHKADASPVRLLALEPAAHMLLSLAIGDSFSVIGSDHDTPLWFVR